MSGILVLQHTLVIQYTQLYCSLHRFMDCLSSLCPTTRPHGLSKSILKIFAPLKITTPSVDAHIKLVRTNGRTSNHAVILTCQIQNERQTDYLILKGSFYYSFIPDACLHFRFSHISFLTSLFSLILHFFQFVASKLILCPSVFFSSFTSADIKYFFAQSFSLYLFLLVHLDPITCSSRDLPKIYFSLEIS